METECRITPMAVDGRKIRDQRDCDTVLFVRSVPHGLNDKRLRVSIQIDQGKLVEVWVDELIRAAQNASP